MTRKLRWLALTLIGLGFLLALDSLYLAADRSLSVQRIPSAKPFAPVTLALEKPCLILSSDSSQAPLKSETVAGSRESIAFEEGPPEYFGWSLAVGFLYLLIWFCFSVVSEDWTAERATYLVKGKMSAITALFFTYAVACDLGWVLLWSTPWWLMGGVLFLTTALLGYIPYSKHHYSSDRRDYIEVEPARPPFFSTIRPLNFIKPFADPAEEICFQALFEAWMRETRDTEPWKLTVAMQKVGHFGIMRALRSIYKDGEFQLSPLEVLDILCRGAYHR